MVMALASCSMDDALGVMDELQLANGTSRLVFEFHNSYHMVGNADFLPHEDSHALIPLWGMVRRSELLF